MKEILKNREKAPLLEADFEPTDDELAEIEADLLSGQVLEEGTRDAMENTDIMRLYSLEIGQFATLSFTDEKRLAALIREGREAEKVLKRGVVVSDDHRDQLDEAILEAHSAREEFINANYRFVKMFAHTYYGSRSELIDLIQEGNLGMMTAVDRYDGSRGFRFGTYAAFWINRFILDALADKSRLVRLSRSDFWAVNKMFKIWSLNLVNFNKRLGPVELARLMGITEQRAENLFKWGSLLMEFESLDVSLTEDEDGDRFETKLRSIFKDEDTEDDSEIPENTAELDAYQKIVDMLIASLGKGEINKRALLIMQHFLGLPGYKKLTVKEIAQKMSVSRAVIYRQIDRCKYFLRKAEGAQQIPTRIEEPSLREQLKLLTQAAVERVAQNDQTAALILKYSLGLMDGEKWSLSRIAALLQRECNYVFETRRRGFSQLERDIKYQHQKQELLGKHDGSDRSD